MKLRYRRSKYLMITFEDLQGGKESGRAAPSSLVLTSVLTGKHLLVEKEELDRLRSIGSDGWSDSAALEEAGFTPARIADLAALGVLISDGTEAAERRLREEEDRLVSSQWPPCAATYHLLNHRQESHVVPLGTFLDTAAVETGAEERAARFVAQYGHPPPAFFSRADAAETIELPLEKGDSKLRETLARRRTTRHFEIGAEIEKGDLSQVLRWVFGAWAKRNLTAELELLMKTSPSGGSLHPIEAFPVIVRCRGLAAGIYHYKVESHAIERLLEIEENDLRRLAVHCAQGQGFVGTCSLLIFLVARFDRNFWKYRERENSYAVVLQDAGHLSQTFQLLATEMGLGAFYTAAMNSEAITQLLGLPYPAHAPVGILGLGRPNRGHDQAVAPEAFDPSLQRR